MPRWPSKPDTWKPTDTTVTVDNVGTISCHADYVRGEPEGKRVWVQPKSQISGGHYVQPERTYWTVTLSFAGHTITSPFNQGSAFSVPPTAEDVLGCLILVLDAGAAEEDFADFCASFGYDGDSRTAERTWNECRDTELKLRRMFGRSYNDVQEWGQER